MTLERSKDCQEKNNAVKINAKYVSKPAPLCSIDIFTSPIQANNEAISQAKRERNNKPLAISSMPLPNSSGRISLGLRLCGLSISRDKYSPQCWEKLLSSKRKPPSAVNKAIGICGNHKGKRSLSDSWLQTARRRRSHIESMRKTYPLREFPSG